MADPLGPLAAARYDGLALSLYLPLGHDSSSYDALIKDLRRDWADALANDGRRVALDRETARVRRVLDELPALRKPAAIFSSEPANLLQMVRLRDEVPAQLWIDDRLHLEPLRQQLAQHPPALIALVDKEHARMFSVVLEEIEEVADLAGQPVRHHRQGGRATNRLQRHEEERAHANLKLAADWLVRQDPAGSRRLFLAGPPTARATFKRYLPKRLQEAIRAEVAAPLSASPTELVTKLGSAW
jgi:peptide subunit release factor 1 (eRF1)